MNVGRKSQGWCCVTFLLILACCSFWGSGCSSGSASVKKVQVADLPPGDGKPECVLASTDRPAMLIERKRQMFQLSGEKGLPFFNQDRLRNESAMIIELTCANHETVFTLKPKARIAFQPNALVLEQGTGHLFFRKVNGTYKVIIPGATLAIRGTRLQATVNEDRSSEVELYEGSVAMIDAAGKETTLNPGQKATFGVDGKSCSIADLGDLPGVFDQLSPDKVRKTIR